jgi:hypothetical protein
MLRVMLPDPPTGADDWLVSAPRHEIKFVGPERAAPFAAATLEAVCPPDDEFPVNRVHTVYFDSRDLASYEEKANGDYLKVKLRLRWYERDGEPRPAALAHWTAWLEIKLRQGSRGLKRRKRVILPPPAPHPGFDPDRLAAVVQEHLGSPRRPSCWLTYSRTRLRGPDGVTRLSIDRNLGVEWMASWLPARPRATGPEVFVIEVKGPTTAVHPGLAALIARHARKSTVSKYALCLDHARGGAR